MELNDDFLREVGLSAMPDDQKESFLAYIEEELEVRIGEKISEGIPEEELKKFEAMDDIDALLWLKENKPDFASIVDKTIDEIKAEVAANRERILA